MREKFYDGLSSFIIGVLFIILGIILLIGQDKLYKYMIGIIVIALLGRVILDMVRYIIRTSNKDRDKKYIISWFFNLGICLLLCFVPDISLGILPFIFSVYLILIGISQFVMCVLEIIDKDYIRIGNVFIGCIYLGIAFPMLLSPVERIDTFIVCFSIYMMLLGISFIYYTFIRVLSVKTRNKIKRRIRITMPKIVEAIIPYSVMLEINRSLEVNKKYSYSYNFDKNNDVSDLDILIHTSNRGVNRMGHIDIAIDGNVYSYGNYDEGSRSKKELFGDGVLFVTDKKSDYINFCIDNSGKTIFDFGIKLSEKQKLRVKKRIDEVFSNAISWDYKSDKKYNNGNSYAAKLYKRVNAKFYKFKKSKYKTYFILGTNCSYLVDDIVGKSGMDILSINGIITPGTYYDYLNKELRLKSSNVISKEIYNSDRRA